MRRSAKALNSKASIGDAKERQRKAKVMNGSTKIKKQDARRLGEFLGLRVSADAKRTLMRRAARATLAGKPTTASDIARDALYAGLSRKAAR